jgi:SAM-dependent methyltransferase
MFNRNKNLHSSNMCELDLNDPVTTIIRRAILKNKGFLLKIYDEWFRTIFGYIQGKDPKILEIGAGPGFSREYSNNIIQTDILRIQGIDVQCDGTNLPFEKEAFDAVIMINVLHHIYDPAQFFNEASRCLMDNGVICMVEPWNTPWSKFIYTNFHFEVFDPSSRDWEMEKGGPLSKSNQAMPWIILSRDFDKFLSGYPEFSIEVFQILMPLAYILSGGFSYRSLVPAFTYGFWRKVEKIIESKQGMFAFIVIRKESKREIQTQ